MRTELDGLRQLEDVRRQFDRERERHRKELEEQASVIETQKFSYRKSRPLIK